MTLSEQELVRRDNLEQIRNLGIEPYPSRSFPVNSSAKELNEGFTEGEESKYTDVVIAGRLMMKRIMGKASFAELQDSSGRIQIYVNRDEVCPDEDKILYNTVFKK